MARLPSLALLIVATLPALAGAADRANSRRFGPSPVLSPYLTLDGSRTVGKGELGFSGLATYESRPLIFYKDGERGADIIGSRLSLDATLVYGVREWIDVGARLPLVLSQSGQQTDAEELPETAFGDLAAALKLSLLDLHTEPLGIAFVLEGTLPTGNALALAGEQNATLAGRLAFEVPIGPRFDVVATGGYRLREDTEIDQITVGDELLLGLGASYRLRPNIALVAETSAAAGVHDPFGSTEETPADGNFGIRFTVWRNIQLIGGAGAGLQPGYGAPTWRGFVGVETIPRRHDYDGDTVVDGTDQCVEVPGLVELIGCPQPKPEIEVAEAPAEADVDTDGDGRPDTEDDCPRIPEDIDGFRDDDGCPDADNDIDFLADADDLDPLAPEDWDGFADADGRPDLDNDQDGVADDRDACPDEPGDGNGCPGSGTAVASAETRAEPGGPVMLGDTLYPAEPISFHLGRPEPHPDSEPALDAMATYIKTHPEFGRIEVGVHVAVAGTENWKFALSRGRALSVAAELAKRGVTPQRLVARGYGSDVSYAAEPGSGRKEGRQRVAFRLVDRSAEPDGAPPGLTLTPDGKIPAAAAAAPAPAPAPAAAPAPAPAPSVLQAPRKSWYSADAVIIRPPSPVPFVSTKGQLRPEAKPILEAVAEKLRTSAGDGKVEVGVHTDGRGDLRWRKRLSQQRAEAVRQALISMGIAPERLVARGYGGTQRLADDSTREGRMQNRRVELIVLDTTTQAQAKPPDDMPPDDMPENAP